MTACFIGIIPDYSAFFFMIAKVEMIGSTLHLITHSQGTSKTWTTHRRHQRCMMERNVCYAMPQEVVTTTANISYDHLPGRSAGSHTDTQIYATIT